MAPSLNILFTSDRFQHAREQVLRYCYRVASHSGFLGNVSPEPVVEDWAALAEIGGFYFEGGLRDFDEWCSQVIRATGEPVRPFLRKVFRELPATAKMRAQQLLTARRSSQLTRTDIVKLLAAFEHLTPSDAAPDTTLWQASLTPSNVVSTTASTVPTGTSASNNNPTGVPETPIKSSDGDLSAGRKTDSLGSLLAELDSYIGLAGVKTDISELANAIRVDHARRAQGLRVPERSLHMVFDGNPGTGKTTMARLVAEIYRELGVLEKGHLVCTDRAGLVANYVGQTASKVCDVVERALGGVLFIDEAYSLAPPDSRNDFGQEALQQLLLLMERHRAELVVIVAGYPDEMLRFLAANPGLSSRFTKKLHFVDYSPEELVQIFEKCCRDNDYRLQERSRNKLLRTVRAAYNHRDKTFGNARLARNLFQESTKNLANRVVGSDLSDSSALMIIEEGDIPDHEARNTNPNRTRGFPDLGIYLASKGMPQKTALVYNSWEMDDLAIMGRGRYCTTRIQSLDGNLYCATFDFGNEVLEQILARAPKSTNAHVKRSLAADPDGVRHLHIPNPIGLGVVAVLGDLQQGMHETFIPLVITNVFGLDSGTAIEAMGLKVL